MNFQYVLKLFFFSCRLKVVTIQTPNFSAKLSRSVSMIGMGGWSSTASCVPTGHCLISNISSATFGSMLTVVRQNPSIA
jgi:hypothetical protein